MHVMEYTTRKCSPKPTKNIAVDFMVIFGNVPTFVGPLFNIYVCLSRPCWKIPEAPSQ